MAGLANRPPIAVARLFLESSYRTSVPSAGDVEQFAYCPQNWYRARAGITSDAGAGVEKHAEIGNARLRAELHRRESLFANATMWWFLGAAVSATLLTLEVLYLHAEMYHWLFLTLALVLLSGSCAALLLSIISNARHEQELRDNGLMPGRLISDGSSGLGTTLHDPEWDLRGTPDFLLETKLGVVPVEVKTGHTPAHPYPSHILQLACYLRLLEANGQNPEYGILQYPDGLFRVAWDNPQRESLQAILGRMGEAERTGVANRDHSHRPRCVGCARREGCPQSLA